MLKKEALSIGSRIVSHISKINPAGLDLASSIELERLKHWSFGLLRDGVGDLSSEDLDILNLWLESEDSMNKMFTDGKFGERKPATIFYILERIGKALSSYKLMVPELCSEEIDLSTAPALRENKAHVLTIVHAYDKAFHGAV